MAVFQPVPEGGGSRDLYVHCTKDCCKTKAPLVRFVDKYAISKPNNFDKTHRVQTIHRTWYCGHCNNVIAASEIRPETQVIGIPALGK